jgi:uncharacterized protein involved in exopolysaccharide biosynthesis
MNIDRIILLISVLTKNIRYIILHVLVLSIFAVSYALSAKKTFTSFSVLIPPGGISTALQSFLPSEMTQGLGGAIGALTGSSGDSSNRILAILNSRKLAELVVNEFDLERRFKTKTIEDAIDVYYEITSFEINQELMISMSVEMETDYFHPEENEEEIRNLVYNICSYLVDYLDSRYTELQTENARFQRITLEKRFEQNKAELEYIQNKAKDFALENNIISLPDQLTAVVETAGALEAEIVQKKIQLNSIKDFRSDGSSEVALLETSIKEMENSLRELYSSEFNEDRLSVLPLINDSAELLLNYAKIEQERTVQTLLFQFLIQQVEQLKIQEAKETPSIQFIDTPRIPDRRSKPSRALLAIIIFSVGMVLSTSILFIKELYKDDLRKIYLSLSDT